MVSKQLYTSRDSGKQEVTQYRDYQKELVILWSKYIPVL